MPVACLCTLALPLWFAARNVHRFVDGDRTIVIPLYAGRDLAVTDRSDLAYHAAHEFAGAGSARR
ncbi:hypothetical protein [Streptomyces hokutonensis]|uniref:hypothetical protein n=1 Tax=Streptomyces hokutonensis TaxID=1306990 RepID=UPI0036A372DF